MKNTRNVSEEESFNCSICLGSRKSRGSLLAEPRWHGTFTTDCGHTFHKDCFFAHVERRRTEEGVSCPYCRTLVPSSKLELVFVEVSAPEPTTANRSSSIREPQRSNPLRQSIAPQAEMADPWQAAFRLLPLAAAVTQHARAIVSLNLAAWVRDAKGFYGLVSLESRARNIEDIPLADPHTVTNAAGVEAQALAANAHYSSESGSHRYRVPVDIVIAIDVSTSMRGSKLRSAKRAAHFVVDYVNSSDRIALVKFANTASTACGWKHMDSASRRELHALIDGLECRRGTNIEAALLESMNVVCSSSDRNAASAVMLLTDGESAYPRRAVNRLKAYKPTTVQVNTFGLGVEHNADLLADVARAGGGTYQYVNDENLAGAFAVVAGTLVSTLFSEVMVTFETNWKDESGNPHAPTDPHINEYIRADIMSPLPLEFGISSDAGWMTHEQKHQFVVHIPHHGASEIRHRNWTVDAIRIHASGRTAVSTCTDEILLKCSDAGPVEQLPHNVCRGMFNARLGTVMRRVKELLHQNDNRRAQTCVKDFSQQASEWGVHMDRTPRMQLASLSELVTQASSTDTRQSANASNTLTSSIQAGERQRPTVSDRSSMNRMSRTASEAYDTSTTYNT